MKSVNIFVCLLLVLTTFTSCSEDDNEEYEPMYASAILNSLYMEIIDRNGKVIDYEKLLEESKLSVVGQVSKKKAKLEVVSYKERKIVRFSVDLPDRKCMIFNADKTAGYGKTNLLMEINGKQITLSVNFDFSSLNKPDFIGGNSIFIKNIEYDGKTISPTEYSIRIRLTGDKPIIEPLQ